jgi:PKD repeat protein
MKHPRLRLASLLATFFLAAGLFASVTFTPANPAAGQTVTFTLTPSNPALVPGTTIDWNFGDGATASTGITVFSVQHVYAAPGIYSVTATYTARAATGAPTPVSEGTRVTVSPAAPKSLTFAPAQPNTYETVTFQAVNFASPSVRWDFGDGTGITNGGTVQTHAFANPGTFIVKAYDGADPTPVTATVTVTNKRTVSFNPAQPNTCENVTFQASGFLSALVRWDFGDGSGVINGTAVQAHAFAAPGTFQVRTYDGNLNMPPLTTTVVITNKRTVTYAPASAKTGLPVTFQAQNFLTPCIRWNFGDGTVVSNGTPTATHVYKSAGTFQVTATDDCGNSACFAVVAVPIAASQGPLAPFALSFVVLRFESGTTNVSVTKDTAGLAAFADLKYEGTGFLQVEWRVDGHPLKTDAVSLPFANQTTITSGPLPGLPTTVPGQHTVSLVILKPAVEFTIPPITYFVAAAPAKPAPKKPAAKVVEAPLGPNPEAPLIQNITPNLLEAGQEYNLKLEGLRLTDATTVSLAGIGVKSFNRTSPTLAWLAVFVSPTAKEGDRPAVATNEKGTNIGPGKVAVVKPSPQPKELGPAQNLCTDVSKLSKEEIEITGPSWMDWPKIGGTAVSGGKIDILPPSEPPKVRVPVIDDFSTLTWKMANPTYDAIEVRFFGAKSKSLIMTKTLPGTAKSLPMTGAVIAELFSHIPQGPPPVVSMAGQFAPGSGYVKAYQAHMGSNAPADDAQKYWSEGIQKADIIWQVFGFRQFVCAYDSVKKTPMQMNQKVEVAESYQSLFKLPDRPNGLNCPAAGLQKDVADISLFNKTKDKRKQGTALANTNLIGDEWVLQGSFSLKNSPYGAQKQNSQAVEIPNLFLDWGDGTGAVPLAGKVKDPKASTWSKSVILDIQNGAFKHVYHAAGTFTVRVFQLSEDDIQAPAEAFGETLSQAVTPDAPAANGPYFALQSALRKSGPSADSGPGKVERFNPLTSALERAYMVYCKTLAVNPYQDACALGPLNLVSVRILDFPGHDILSPQSASTEGIRVRADLIAAMAGVDAVAVTCDTALHARAELTYFGRGDAEIVWKVDGVVVSTDANSLRGLASDSRGNLGPYQAADCAGALTKKIIVQSGKFPVDMLGKHKVTAEVRVVHSFVGPGLDHVLGPAMVKKLQPGGAGAGSSGPGGPSVSGPAGEGPSNPWLAALAGAQKSGQPVPEMGFLNPNQHASGTPPAAYLNDLTADPGFSWSDPEERIVSEAKTYLVNEVRDKLGCKVSFPTTGGDFSMTDMGSGVTLSNIKLDPDDTYSGSGILHVFVYLGQNVHEEKFVAGAKFKGWTIDETTARVTNGGLDVASGGAGALLSLPGVWGTLRRLEGNIANNVPEPMRATFDVSLKSPNLRQLKGGAAVPVVFPGVAAPLTAQGDWYAAGVPLPDWVELGQTGFALRNGSPGVTIDFSANQSPASSQVAGPSWAGVFIGPAEVRPHIPLDLTAKNPLAMNTPEDWVVQNGGLSGKSKSGPFASDIGEGSLAFQSVEFGMSNDVPSGKYIGLAVKVPWIEAVLKGDAELVLLSPQDGYGTQMVNVTSPPVTRTYDDLGRVSLTASNFLLTTDPLGPVVRCGLGLDFQAEGLPFAAFAVNEFYFAFDGRARLAGQSSGLTLPLSGQTAFGQSKAELQSVALELPTQGQERLTCEFKVKLSMSESEYVPAVDAAINYHLLRTGAEYVAKGPWTSPFTMGLVYPLGSQDVQGQVSPSYTPQTASPLPDEDAFGPWGAPPSGGRDIAVDGDRFSGSVELDVIGGKILAIFKLGYKNGKSYFLNFANIPVTAIPLSPIPLAIYGFQGGFGYNFPTTAFEVSNIEDAEPDMKGTVSFCAGLTFGTADGGNVLKMSGRMALGSDGVAFMEFYDVSILGIKSNFGALFKYAAKVFDGRIFGDMDLYNGLVNFSLGTKSDPAMGFTFGGGGWLMYAGKKEGPRVKATIWNVAGADSYFMMGGDVGLVVGGSIYTEMSADVWIASAYVKGWLDMGLQVTPPPGKIRFIGDFAAGVEAGGCVDVELFEGCVKMSVTAAVHAEAPDPTLLQACVTISFPVVGDESFCAKL